MRSELIQLIVILVAISSSSGQETKPGPIGISGVVQYPDGNPSAGATVTGRTTCDREPYHLVHTTKTSADGSFHLPSFDSECTRVQLSASKLDDLWLNTGTDIFYPRENGTAPIVDTAATGSPAATVIVLGERGALVRLRVRDKATQQFIQAYVSVKRLPVPGAKFGSMLAGTGKDGSADTLFLPAGEYEFSVDLYDCNRENYLAARSPHETLTVEAGQRVAEDISLDVRQMKTLKSPTNQHGKPCEPLQQGHSVLH